ncbi:CDP-diacylglycerol diphosphatase [Serratia sp. UGAL515B_01]|uniref:CDP-diacylglycerol diphosphatase n=1 Tax=Serratia sp. UGAL515B_01 TaxID=2986763 RepID=UPI002955736A|nr:CDP-diacylglycerol diphosphatase [Serratia sp. UGAL515B_01]WON76815.1 CDP-diacylglycerol diphosphatase [Serratia sp. UGAL515B_01]
MLLRHWLFLSAALVVAAATALYAWLKPAHPDALWHIINQQCLPNQRQNHHPAPCTQVDEQAGFVVLKDRNGPLQYLLLPSTKISGIESPQILEPETANFFVLAWQARHFMANRYGEQIDDANISLAVNSEYGRTQNQLHIHISCLQPAVKNKLAQLQVTPSEQWQPFPGGLMDKPYLFRRVSTSELQQQGAFRLLAQGVDGASENMGSYGMAMSVLPDGNFLLLAIKRNFLQLNMASAEELQDHNCKVLQ